MLVICILVPLFVNLYTEAAQQHNNEGGLLVLCVGDAFAVFLLQYVILIYTSSAKDRSYISYILQCTSKCPIYIYVAVSSSFSSGLRNKPFNPILFYASHFEFLRPVSICVSQTSSIHTTRAGCTNREITN